MDEEISPYEAIFSALNYNLLFISFHLKVYPGVPCILCLVAIAIT